MVTLHLIRFITKTQPIDNGFLYILIFINQSIYLNFLHFLMLILHQYFLQNKKQRNVSYTTHYKKIHKNYN